MKENDFANDYDFNGLRIGTDWLSFTLNSTNLVESLALFGFELADFKLMPKGAQGYRHMLRHPAQAITVLYDGAADMGIHIDVKGSAIAFFLKVFRESFLHEGPFGPVYEADENGDFLPDDVLCHLFRKILEEGHFTRLDISVDDLGCSYFSVCDIVKILDSGNYISKFRKWKHIIEKDTAGKIIGNTVYMGSRQSDVMLRIYNKQLEQLKKENAVPIPWVRWEFELKDMRADVFADIVSGKDNSFGELGMRLLSSYLRFIVPNDSNKSRCSTLPLWQKFINCVEKLCITLPKSEKSVEKSLDWIKRQCMPTIAGLTLANLGDMSFLTEHMAEHYNRLCYESRSVFEGYRDAQIEKLQPGK